MAQHLPAAALFDLDGVLMDSETIYTQIWQNIERVYPTGIEDFARKIKGNTLTCILDTHFPDPEVRRAVVELLLDYERKMQYVVFPGVMEFLEQLRAAGVPMVIVTSSSDEKMERIACESPEFMSYFTALVTDSCVTYSKPHPEPYLTGAYAVDADPAQCIVFEDSYTGMASGRAAGAAVVGLATTNPRESIVDKADVVIDSFGGLTLDDLLSQLSEAGRSF